jgi:hypothetical protein
MKEITEETNLIVFFIHLFFDLTPILENTNTRTLIKFMIIKVLKEM